MSKLKTLWHNIVYNKTFIRIISIVIAVVVWALIVNVANPSNIKEFSDIPIVIDYENTTPYRNGLMMMTQSSEFKVNITVEGPRTSLLTLNKDNIKASLDMDSYTTDGTYSVPVKITLPSNKGMTVKEISPSKSFVIKFVKSGTKNIPITVDYAGDLGEGYVIESENLTPSTISVTGPSEVINTINEAYISINLQNKDSAFVDTDTVKFRDSSGKEIDKSYLTYDSDNIDARIDVAYTKTVPFELNLFNSEGGNENQYTNLTWSQDNIIISGEKADLEKINSVNLGTLNLSDLTGTTTITYDLPSIENVNYRNANISRTVSVKVDMGKLKTKVFDLSAYNLNQVVSYKNSSTTGLKVMSGVKFSIRSQADVIDKITRADLSFYIDMSQGKSDSQYKLHVILPDGYAGTLLGEYYVTVN